MAELGELTPWSHPARLSDVQREPVQLRLDANDVVRARVAEALDLAAVGLLTAQVVVSPWQDGLNVRADWRATVPQTCGVSLEPFDTELSGEFTVKAVPADSPMIQPEEPEAEIGLDTPDPPDVLDGDSIDVAALVVEHLALEIDPYPRTPGAVFEAPEETAPESPFAALAALKPREQG